MTQLFLNLLLLIRLIQHDRDPGCSLGGVIVVLHIIFKHVLPRPSITIFEELKLQTIGLGFFE